MKRISAVRIVLFLTLCLLFSSAVAEERPTTAPPSTEPYNRTGRCRRVGSSYDRGLCHSPRNRWQRQGILEISRHARR